MGIWEIINSTTDAIKRNVPDTTSVTGACRRSYDLGSSALAKVDNAVRVHGIQKLNDCVSDPQARQNIVCHLTSVAKNVAIYGVEEGVKFVPGGSLVCKSVLQSLNENKTSEHNKKLGHVPEEIKVLQAENMKLQVENEKLWEEIRNIKALVEPKKAEPSKTSGLGSFKTQELMKDGINICYDGGVYASFQKLLERR